jgi:hypothetical protein
VNLAPLSRGHTSAAELLVVLALDDVDVEEPVDVEVPDVEAPVVEVDEEGSVPGITAAPHTELLDLTSFDRILFM